MLVLNEAKDKFLVCKPKNAFISGVKEYILPGGQIESNESDLDCVKRETMEELSAKIKESSLKFIGEYQAPSASDPNKPVNIKLYIGTLLGEPKAADEIESLHWIGKEDQNDPQVSNIIRTKIIPDLIARGILK